MLKVQNDDNWKIALRSELITAITGDPQKREEIYYNVGRYYQCYAPASLYKYYSDAPRKLSEVKSNKMWYSAPCKFNDIFDCDICFNKEKIFNNTLRMIPGGVTIRAGSPQWKQLRAAITRELPQLGSRFESLKKAMGISCLSESEKSLLMWAHYANNHCGMCVEYDLLEINRQLKFSPVPVIYSDDRVCLDIVNLETLEPDAIKIFVESLTSKSLEWSYEKEWRIIRDQSACGNKWDVKKEGALLDMIRPSSIILGYAAKPEFEKEVKEYCQSNKINLYKMKKHDTLYALEKNPILEFES